MSGYWLNAQAARRSARSHRNDLQPILPLSRTDDVPGQNAVGDCMGDDAVPKVARADHPPVVNDAGREPNIPKGPMLRSEEDRRQPESCRGIRAQRDFLEVSRIDEPAHEPSAPEKLFEDRHRERAYRNTEEE